MDRKGTENDLVSFVGIVVALWLGYLCFLASIDYTILARPVFSLPNYLINGSDALTVLGLCLWPRSKILLGRFFLPLVIILLSVVPIVSGNLVVLRMPPSPAGNPEAILLRLLPMMLMPLILTAWKYSWKYAVIFTLATAGLNLGLHGWYYRSGGAPFMPPVAAFIIQAVNFLLVGYFISTLMRRLRDQNTSLEQVNAKLLHYTMTLEHLAVSQERNRLARELHDTLAHTLSALSVQLETAKAYFDVDLATARNLIDTSLQQTRSGLAETRIALKALRACPLDNLGLLAVLRKMSEEVADRGKIKLHILLPSESAILLSPDVEQTIYRIAQESLANVGHHANAGNLTVKLSIDDDRISLIICDDGIGFNVEKAEDPGHFGLLGMRERAQLTGGHLAISSSLGQGTTVQFTKRG